MQRAGKENPAIQGSHYINEPSTAQTTKQKNHSSRRAKYLMTFLLVVVFVTAVISLAFSLDNRKSAPDNGPTHSDVPAEAEKMKAPNQVANKMRNLSLQLEDLRNELKGQNFAIANLSQTSGPPGPPGKNGAKGDKGKQGLRGEKGLIGEVGQTGRWGESGPKGDQGEKGEKGEHGSPGPQGRQGTPGIPGVDGLPGDFGRDGRPGEPGPAGRAGFNGSQGMQGAPGPPGPAGPRGTPGHNALRPNASDAKDPSQFADKPSAQLMGGDHHQELYAADQVLTKWNPNDTNSYLMNGFEYSQGKLRVPWDGRYHVYAQLYINSTEQAPSNRVAIFAGNRSVLIIQARPVGEETRFAAGVFQLAKGEMVYVKVIHVTKIWLGPNQSSFGAYMI